MADERCCLCTQVPHTSHLTHSHTQSLVTATYRPKNSSCVDPVNKEFCFSSRVFLNREQKIFFPGRRLAPRPPTVPAVFGGRGSRSLGGKIKTPNIKNQTFLITLGNNVSRSRFCSKRTFCLLHEIIVSNCGK